MTIHIMVRNNYLLCETLFTQGCFNLNFHLSNFLTMSLRDVYVGLIHSTQQGLIDLFWTRIFVLLQYLVLVCLVLSNDGMEQNN